MDNHLLLRLERLHPLALRLHARSELGGVRHLLKVRVAECSRGNVTWVSHFKCKCVHFQALRDGEVRIGAVDTLPCMCPERDDSDRSW